MIWPMASTFYATKFFVRGKQEVTNAENGSRERPESKCLSDFSYVPGHLGKPPWKKC